MLKEFTRKWRNRFDFVWSESTAQARGLVALLHALSRLPANAGTPIVLTANPAVARFLERVPKLAAAPRPRTLVVQDQGALELYLAGLAERNCDGPVIVAGDLYVRFPSILVPYAASGRVVTA